MSERVLFCRVCWMEHYRGVDQESEKPQHGGKWIADGETPWESRNFEVLDGYVYGFARPVYHSDHANLRRIDAAFRSGYLEDVRVIFFARAPMSHVPLKQVVIGWYARARVWENSQYDLDEERHGLSYMFRARARDAFLLPVEQRTFQIAAGEGGVGQSNWTYPLDARGRPKDLRRLVPTIEYTKRMEAKRGAAGPPRVDAPVHEADPLPEKRETTRWIHYDERTVKARQLHDKLSNALRSLFGDRVRGSTQRPFFDALIPSTNAAHPDVLIEIKPDLNDRDALRMAIGQLYDYAYELDRQGGPRILRAALGGCAPGADEREILRRAGVDALWIEGDKTPLLRGMGRSFDVLSKLLLRKQAGSQRS